jgi:hypothetical protein
VTSIKDQIAAARALAIKTSNVHWTLPSAQVHLDKMASALGRNATLLERACELLEDASASLYGDRYAAVRAFLAGECSKCDGTGEIRCDRDDIAAALRKAAADEREVARERAAQIAETHVGYHVNGVAHSIAAAIRSDGCDGCLACRARAKGGA